MGYEVALVGVKSIKMGPCGTNGTLGASLAAIGILVPDSVLLALDEIGKTDIMVEDYTNPWFSVMDTNRPSRFEFSIRDLSGANMQKAFGGTAVGTRWSAPTLQVANEQSLDIETTTVNGFHYRICIPRASIRASLDGKMVQKDTAAIKFVCDVLTPLDGSGVALPAITIDKVTG